MAVCKTLQTNGELDVARADDVLNLELGKLRVESELLDDTRVLARCETGVVLGLCTSDDHLARGEDQGCRLGLTNAHDDGSETLGRSAIIVTNIDIVSNDLAAQQHYRLVG